MSTAPQKWELSRPRQLSQPLVPWQGQCGTQGPAMDCRLGSPWPTRVSTGPGPAAVPPSVGSWSKGKGAEAQTAMNRGASEPGVGIRLAPECAWGTGCRWGPGRRAAL